jgi:general secretion pathway protein E
VEIKPFEFTSKSHMIEFLTEQGYEINENAKMKGKSGAEHTLDILATRDEGIITHHIAIGIKVDQELIGLDKIFDFDDKAYDIGIQDKVFIAIPGITEEARHFAERQQIRIFEATEI